MKNSAARKIIVESLEVRSLLTTVVGADGTTLGYTRTIIPAGGIHIATDAEMRSGRASGDGAPGYQITLNFTGGLTASQQAAFTTAAARWQSAILGDLPDVGGIDDVRIDASGAAIDGVGNILGQAGPTGGRNAANHFIPYQGVMQFDTADLASLEAQGQLVDVITHEMGHVLGVGTIWGSNALITGAGGSNPIFTGATAKAEYAKMIGTLTSTDVPVENTGGSGTRDSHWRESTYNNELMTGFINSGPNPLSRVTVGSLIDMGYPQVDLEAAELYTRSNAIPTIGTLNATPIVQVNSSVTLTLTSANDVSSIQFYRETNGIPGLQATGTTTRDTLVSTISSGLSTTVSMSGLLSGNYTFYAVVKDAFNLQSAFKSASVQVIDTIAPPSTPVLSTASDLGFSNSDGLTADNTPTLTGSGPLNATINLFDGGSPLGSTASDGSGVWSFTSPVLTDGLHSITAVATDGVNTSSTSGALSINIETVAPVLVSATYDRDSTQDVTLTFGEALATQVTAAKLTLTNTTTNTTVGIASVTYAGGNTIAKISFVPLFLPNGRYVLSMPATGVTDAAGNPLSAPMNVDFVQLAGDANGDGTVDFSDLLVVAQNFNQNGKTFSQGNFNYDASGIVDFSDLLIVAQNYNVSLVQSSVLSTVSLTKRRGSNTRDVLA